ncbi:MAG: TonB-dependent receptor, partial [Flavobacteriales bacterium]|nr:TonB-dependent receptor [Flavobacteriales bacterium]
MKRKIYILLLIFHTLFTFGQTDTAKIHILDEVVVTGSRERVELRLLPINVSVIGNKQIKQRHDASILPLLTEQIPGLFITSRGVLGYGVASGAAGGISLRGIGGSPTTAMLILIDGHPQYMGLMGHPIADAYQSTFAEKVEVVRGPASVLYGSNAMGGVINIITNTPTQDGVKGNALVSYGSFNTLTSDLTAKIKHRGFSATVSAWYNNTDGHRERMDFEQFGGYIKLGYIFSEHWSVNADVNITHFNASNPGTVSSPVYDNDSYITRGMSSFSLENTYSKASGALKIFYNWGFHKINDGYSQGQDPKEYLFHSKDIMLGVNMYQNISLTKSTLMTIGADYQLFGGKAWNAFFNENSTDIVDTTMNEIAIYADFRQKIMDIMTIDAGIRYDNHSQSGAQ